MFSKFVSSLTHFDIKGLIISPKFEISGMLWFWSGRPAASAAAARQQACVSRNCDSNARIKFIFDTTIDDLEWKNPIDFGENRKTKWPPTAILWKYDEKDCALHNFIKNAPINFTFNVATDIL